MSFDDQIANIEERNRLRDITHPIGAVYKGDGGYWRVCRHGSTTNTFSDHTGVIRSISSGFTSEGISKDQYIEELEKDESMEGIEQEFVNGKYQDKKDNWYYRTIENQISDVKEITHFEEDGKVILRCKFIKTKRLIRKTPTKILGLIPWTKIEVKYEDEYMYCQYKKFDGDWYNTSNSGNISKMESAKIESIIICLDAYCFKVFS